MSDDYLWNRKGQPDPDVARLEDLLAPLAFDPARAKLDELSLRRRRPRAPWVVSGLVLAAAAALTVWWLQPATTSRAHIACSGGSGFRFASHGGEVACSDAELRSGVLPVGAVLDTGLAEADLSIGEIGTAVLGPHTRLRLDATGADGHRLTLEHGRIHARVSAPPRVFAVTTRHVDVIDLGCEYTIEIDDTGVGSIAVQSGKVELATRAGIVVVPQGTHAVIGALHRPALPIADGASADLEAAASGVLAERPGALTELLSAATEADAITLVTLASLDANDREAIVRRLIALAPLPAGTALDEVARDPAALSRWRDQIIATQAGHGISDGKGKATPEGKR